MDLDTLKRLLARRGYAASNEPRILAPLHAEGYTGTLKAALAGFDASAFVQWIDTILGQGQLHKQCLCGQAVLVSQEIDLNRPPRYRMGFDRRGQDIIEVDPHDANKLFERYRDVAKGPESPSIERCPHCGAVLSSETVKDIEDVS